jgi:hypothetical protein
LQDGVALTPAAGAGDGQAAVLDDRTKQEHIVWIIKLWRRWRCRTMSESEKAVAESLTGVWNGIFRHPFHPAVNFTATVIESSCHITGTTHEPCMQLGCPRRTHLATLAGSRMGCTVSFLKTYDPPENGYDTVVYSGVLNGDATEIAGMWTLEAGLSDAFVMTRAGRNAQVRERRKLAIVRS